MAAKRQLAKAGVALTALDNGFATCEDPALLQRLCDRLGPGAVTALFWRWQRRLPSPLTRDDLRGGYVYTWRSGNGGHQSHHPGIPEPQGRGVLAVIGARRPGHLVESGHVGSGHCAFGLSVTHRLAGVLASSAQGVPVLIRHPSADAEVAGVSDLQPADCRL
jgi:hypothetical protein